MDRETRQAILAIGQGGTVSVVSMDTVVGDIDIDVTLYDPFPSAICVCRPNNYHYN